MLYNITSPDGLSIRYEDFHAEQEALDYFKEWRKGFEKQGYYSSCRQKINLPDLHYNCTLVSFDKEFFWKDKSGRGFTATISQKTLLDQEAEFTNDDGCLYDWAIECSEGDVWDCPEESYTCTKDVTTKKKLSEYPELDIEVTITDEQRKWLEDFIVRWDAMMEAEWEIEGQLSYSMQSLLDEYEKWCRSNRLPHWSAEDLVCCTKQEAV